MVDCVIFSIGRAASTSIYRYLDEMCTLNLPANKEPHYWLDRALDYQGVSDTLREIYVADDGDYNRLYADARFSIDASVGYYHYAEKVVAKLQAAGEAPKALMLVREPASWARSLHTENLFQGIERRQRLEEALAEDRSDADLWWQLRYRHVRYIEVHEILSAAFPQLMVVDYDDFCADVAGTMRAICAFLGLKVVNGPSGKVFHSSRERGNRLRLANLHRFGGWIPAAVRRPVGQLLLRLPVGKLAEVREDVLMEAMAESMASYRELRALTAAHIPPEKSVG